MKKSELFGLEHQLCFALYSASLTMTKVYNQYLTPIGMTYPQYVIMQILWEKDGVALKEIASRLDIKSGGLTPVLKRMECEGWLTRVRGLENDRTLSIQLTEVGKELHDKTRDMHNCIADSYALKTHELSFLQSELVRLKNNLKNSLLDNNYCDNLMINPSKRVLF